MTFLGKYARFDLANETTRSFCDGLSETCVCLFSSFDFGMIETGNLFNTASWLRGGQQGSVSFPVLFLGGKRRVIGAVDGRCCPLLVTRDSCIFYG